jgi:hypothetical protein
MGGLNFAHILRQFMSGLEKGLEKLGDGAQQRILKRKLFFPEVV